MKFYNYLIEELKLIKKKWQVVNLNDLDQDMRHKLWDMYVDTYQGIGLHIESSKQLTNKYKVSWLIDVDQDPLPDAFIIYKETKYGNKLALMGSDGTKSAKHFLIKQAVSLLKSKGWFCEVSHKIADIFINNNVPIINDMNFIQNVIGKEKFVMELENGEYKRKLGTLGVVKKRVVGTI